MENKDKKTRNKIDEEELLELEYELLEASENRRPKRLRSKEQKSKKSRSELIGGIVLECFSNNLYRVETDDGKTVTCPLSGRFKNVDFANTRSIVAVGDRVRIDLSADPLIEEIDDRKNVLRRYIPRSFPDGESQIRGYDHQLDKEVILAANIDQVIVTSSIANPSVNFNLIDRYLCSAELSGIEPIICITKIDLKNPETIYGELNFYRRFGFRVALTSAADGTGISELIGLLKDRNTVFSGPSGVGKSSLINRLEPSLNLKTGSISTYSNKGKHVTSNSIMIKWSFGGYLIDTPGIKTFGLSRQIKDRLPRVFPGFKDLALHCRFTSCTHTAEENCRVKEALDKGDIPENRYQSYINLLGSL